MIEKIHEVAVGALITLMVYGPIFAEVAVAQDAGTEIADQAAAKKGTFGEARDNQCKNPKSAEDELGCVKIELKKEHPNVDIAVGGASHKTKNPKEALDVREMLFVQAVLIAKMELAQAYTTRIKAKDKTILKEGEVGQKDDNGSVAAEKRQLLQKRKQLSEDIDAIMNDLKDVKGRQKLKRLEQAEDPRVFEKLVALLDGTIKRVDPSYNPEKLQKSRNRNLSREDAQYLELLSELRENANQLKQQQAKISSDLVKIDSGNKSKTARVSELSTEQVLHGATILDTAESYNASTGSYEVAVMVAWSENLGRRAKDALTGNYFPENENSQPLTIDQYVDRLDINGMIGGNWVITSDGTPWFLGYGMALASDKTVAQRASRIEARSMAITNLAFMMFSNLQANTKIEKDLLILERDDNKGITKTSRRMAENIRAEIERLDFPVETLAQVTREIHPRFGLPVNIVVVATNARDNAHVKEKLLSQNKAIAAILQSQSYRRGFIDRLKKIREAKKNDPASYSKGASDAKKGMQKPSFRKQRSQPQQRGDGTIQEGISRGGGMNTKGI
jgi:hypothetical protein